VPNERARPTKSWVHKKRGKQARLSTRSVGPADVSNTLCDEGFVRTNESQIRLTAVVVTYNRLDQLRKTVAALLNTSREELAHLLVINNASDDGTAHWLTQQNDPRLHVIQMPENIGGAGGFAEGVRQARKLFDPDWLVLMDDDGRPSTDAIPKFHTEDLAGWDAIASAVYYPTGEICEMNRPSRNPFQHTKEFLRTLRLGRSGFHILPEVYAGKEIVPIDVTSFVGFFISRKGLDIAGEPDPSLFIYGDDGLYTLGLTQKGGKIGFCPTVQFEHDCSTFDGQRGAFRPIWKAYFYHRNLLLLYRLAAGWKFWLIAPLIIAKWLSKIKDHKNQKRNYLKLISRAVIHGLTHNTKPKLADVKAWL